MTTPEPNGALQAREQVYPVMFTKPGTDEHGAPTGADLIAGILSLSVEADGYSYAAFGPKSRAELERIEAALRTSPPVQAEREREDAERWQALMSSPRIRFIGGARQGQPDELIGVEFYGEYPGRAIGDQYARTALLDYVDRRRAALQTDPPERKEPAYRYPVLSAEQAAEEETRRAARELAEDRADYGRPL